jgi:predicted HAD superfamily Cof-like phosphohydrolase
MASKEIQSENHMRTNVLEFHKAMGQPILESPTVPPDERVRLRARLILEEAFEFLEACFQQNGERTRDMINEAKAAIAHYINRADVLVRLTNAADALADIKYVVEGTFIEMGIDSGPVDDEVHRSNMAKTGGGSRVDGKILKPAGWAPPDIASVLETQRGAVMKDPRSAIEMHHDGAHGKHWMVIDGERVECLSATYGDSLTRQGAYSTHATARFALDEYQSKAWPALSRHPWSVEFIYEDEGKEWSDLLAGITMIAHRSPDRDGSVSIAIEFLQFYWGKDRKTLNNPPKAPMDAPIVKAPT